GSKLQTRLGSPRHALAGRRDLLPRRAGPEAAPPLRTAADVLDLLEQLTAAVWADPWAGPRRKRGPPATSPGSPSRRSRSATSPAVSKCWRPSSSSDQGAAPREYQGPGQAVRPTDSLGAPAADPGRRGAR